MSDSPPPNPSNSSTPSEGGVTLQGRDITIGGDPIGRDKIINNTINIFTGPHDLLERRNRRRMLEKVWNDRVKDELEQSLYNATLIELRMEYKPKATPSTQPLPLGTKIAEIFDRANSELLILGEPGSGKTTMLLQLTRELIARAERDEMQPVPVVFKLSSWAEKRPPLTKWLAEELGFYFRVRKEIATKWVKDNYVLPLLDGLDEVKLEHRAACVEAINHFRQEYGLMPMVVCSRSADYEALNNQLRLRGVIVLRPLTREQIDSYLDHIGEQLASLRVLLRDDATLQELAESPLMLSIMARTYEETPITSLPKLKTIEARRKYLFDTYIQQMFKHRSSNERYAPPQVIHWLSWLAQKMIEHDQTTFYLERMQLSLVPNESVRRRYKMMTGLIGGLIVGLAFGLTLGLVYGSVFNPVFGLAWAVVSGLIGFMGGLVYGVVGRSKEEIKTVETLRWSWFDAISVIIIGLIIGLIVGIIFGPSWGLATGLVIGVIYGPIFGLNVGKEIETKTIPNQGIWRSAQNAMLVGLVNGLVSGLVAGPIIGPFFESASKLITTPVVELTVGLTVGLLSASRLGGFAFIQHMVLRFMLYRRRAIPWDYVHFLDYCVERIFLHKVGGGYIFAHRLLMEYFAGLEGEV